MNNNKTGDFFADIALLKRSKIKAGLIEPKPSTLPSQKLPLKKLKSSARFSPLSKIDSSQKLQKELGRTRKDYAPFLRELAPALQSLRQRISITKFDWRLVQENSLAEFNLAKAGKGKWEKVTIPHFGGPIGRATAYYRTTFVIPEAMKKSGFMNLVFKGVDYKAQVYLNGAFVGSHEGFFSPFEFEVGSFLKGGLNEENELLVKVENDAVMMGNMSWGGPCDGDKIYASTGVGWDDPELGWHHCPPGMGIYNEVYFESRASLSVKDLFVRPNLAENRAEVLVEVHNATAETISLSLFFSLFGRNFKETIVKNKKINSDLTNDGALFLAQEKSRLIKAGPGVNFYRFPIDLEEWRLWSSQTPWLYEVQIEVQDENKKSLDRFKRSFGMRSFEINETEKPYGRMFLNGKEVRLRGANTMGFEQHDVMRKDWGQLVDDILLAKLAHFNFLRLTQRPVQEEIYDYCDRLGLMVQTDLPLFGVVRKNQFCELIRQVEEMERLIRSHPSCVLVTFINEPYGFNMGGQPHRHMTREELELFFTAAQKTIYMTNPDRAIKAIDGDYDAPGPGISDNHCYNGWYGNHGLDIGRQYRGYWQPVKKDWMFGCGEYGAEGLDPVDLMRRRYPKNWLPKSKEEEGQWTPHPIIKSQTGDFHHVFFDTPNTLENWVRESHEHQAWVVRLQSEAFRRESRLNTCAVHLFIDAFPSGWMKSIMDCERNPKQAYFAIRDAFAPLMVNLRSDRWGWFEGEQIEIEAWICNDTHESMTGSELRYQFEQEGAVLLAESIKAEVPRCASRFQGKIVFEAPTVKKRTNCKLRLGWFDIKGESIHESEFKVAIFPRNEPMKVPVIQVIESKERTGTRLLKELGWKAKAREEKSEVYLVTDFSEYLKNEKSILKAVEGGATLVILDLPSQKLKIADFEIEVLDCKMGPRNFVSRKTGHRFVENCEKNDFRFWKEKESDCVLPLLLKSFRAQGWTPILVSGEPGSQGKDNMATVGLDWKKTLAAGEVRWGQGMIRISLLQLQNRIEQNPPAMSFAQQLLSKA